MLETESHWFHCRHHDQVVWVLNLRGSPVPISLETPFLGTASFKVALLFSFLDRGECAFSELLKLFSIWISDHEAFVGRRKRLSTKHALPK